MKKTLSTRRIARKIGQDDDDDNNASTGSESHEPIVKRLSLASKTKKKSALRLSFGPGQAEENDGETSAAATPRKSNLSRLAIERNAERKTLRPAISSDQLAFRAGNGDRPSYTKDSLAELKQSTPSTPKDVPSVQTSEDEETETSLDVLSKFGPTITTRPVNSAIPSEAEIKEKKERRARLAQEKDFISLNPDDSDQERQELLLRPKEKYAETRLVREDEDLAEGFDEYVEDGKISLGRKAEREEKRRKRKEMEELIQEAEGVDGSDEESDASEQERTEAYEAAQTKAGTYSQRQADDGTERPKTPPRIAPIPELGSVIARLRTGLQAMEDAKTEKIRKLEELRTEKKEIAEREVWIQAQLKEVGEKFERLRKDAGMVGAANGVDGVGAGEKMVVHRGLETFGSQP